MFLSDCIQSEWKAFSFRFVSFGLINLSNKISHTNTHIIRLLNLITIITIIKTPLIYQNHDSIKMPSLLFLNPSKSYRNKTQNQTKSKPNSNTKQMHTNTHSHKMRNRSEIVVWRWNAKNENGKTCNGNMGISNITYTLFQLSKGTFTYRAAADHRPALATRQTIDITTHTYKTLIVLT